MLGVNENSACNFHIRWNEYVKFQGQLKRLRKQGPIKMAYFSMLSKWVSKNSFTAVCVELHRQA